jgi:MFS family permease
MKASVTEGEFSRGWPVVFASAVGMMLGVTGIPFYTIGVFAKPLIEEFGWSRAQYQGAFMATLIGAATAPLVGYLCDRFGVRRIALWSTAGFAAGMAGIGIITGPAIASFYLAWVMMAVVAQGTGPLAWTRIIGEWFAQRRGLALGLALMGTGFTAVIGPPAATALIAALGWRWAYCALGGVVLIVSWPILWKNLRSPAVSVIATSASAPDAREEQRFVGASLGAALRDYRFWTIALAFIIAACAIAGVISNLVPLMTDRGVAPAKAAAFSSLIGVAVIVGRIVVGYLLDRLWAPSVAAVVFALAGVAAWGLGWIPINNVSVVPVLLMLGFAAGAEFDLLAFLISRYFGLKNYGKIYGVQYAIFFVGAAIGPRFFGASFDAHGGYGYVLNQAGLGFSFSALILLTLGRFPEIYSPRALATIH